MKNLILLLLLIPMFCKVQEPSMIKDYGFSYRADTFDVDTFFITDTTLQISLEGAYDQPYKTIYIGDIIGISDTNYFYKEIDTSIIISQDHARTPKGEVITGIQITAENRLYKNQNKPSMKKFEYAGALFLATGDDRKQINETANAYGKIGWEAYTIDFKNRIIYFKREIQE